MKGLKVPKSETIEIIAYECLWCGRAFRERTLSRHRCQKKAKALGIEERGPFREQSRRRKRSRRFRFERLLWSV